MCIFTNDDDEIRLVEVDGSSIPTCWTHYLLDIGVSYILKYGVGLGHTKLPPWWYELKVCSGKKCERPDRVKIVPAKE